MKKSSPTITAMGNFLVLNVLVIPLDNRKFTIKELKELCH